MNKLTSWIREMEKEKQMLNLKHVALIRLPKLLRKIQSLLEKIPTGEKLFKQLSSVQSDLKTSFNSSVLHSVKSELHSCQERLSSLKAGLLTWNDHLKRLEQLSTECKDLKEKIEGDLKHPEDHLNTAIPVNIPEVSRDRETCTGLLTNLDIIAERLRSLDNLHEDLSESLAPSDIKQLSQTLWLLGQRHSDDKHKLLVRMQILQMRMERMDLFHSHQSRFVTWIDKMRSNIDQKESRVSDLIFIFENHYRFEIEQKQKDMDNLIKLKDQMTKEKFSDSDEITQKTDDALKQYKDLKNHFDKKLAKLHQILDAQLKLETELQELKQWLSEIEKRINEPMKFE